MLRFTPVVLALVVVASSNARADGPERLDSEKAKRYGQILAEAAAKLDDLPIKLKLDGDQAMGMTAGEKGAMLVPAAGLTLEAIRKIDKEIQPIGLLAMHKVGAAADGEAIPADKMRTTEVSAGDKTATITVAPLAAARVAGRLVLLVYGKDKAPVIVGVLREAEHANSSPLKMEVRKGDKDGTALMLIGVLGQYKASLTVVAQE